MGSVETIARSGSVHLLVVPHTHWDREWYQPFQEFRRRLVRLVDRLLDTLDADPEFSHFHLDGQTIVLEDYLEIRPERGAQLRRLIRSGRIAVGPWYVLPDEFLVSGESIIRNLRIGQRTAAAFGADAAVGYLPDQFGHIAQMPQILAGFGLSSAVVWRGVGADVRRTEFAWQAPDGTEAFTVYMPSGYSLGRALPLEPAALRKRLAALVGEIEPFRQISSVLIMNGTDHQEAQAGLPAALRAALAPVEGVSAEIASLSAYVARARREAGESPVRHAGELRSPLRAHLLPGVTSVRVRQKQRDFANLSRLERYAEPLATWADALAGRRDLTAFTEHAWKLSVQNHPHDSICGCSVDQVHRDMEFRFDQVDLILRQVQRQAFAAIAACVDTTAAAETALLVYNPNPAGRALLDVEVPLDLSGGVSLHTLAGEGIVAQVEQGSGALLLDVELPPAALRGEIEGLQSREFLGFFLNGIRFDRADGRLKVQIVADLVPRGSFDVMAARGRWLELLDDASLELVHVHARTATPARLIAAAPLNGHGLTLLSLRHHASAETPPSPFAVGVGSIENRWYRVAVGDDGSLSIADKELGLELGRCNWFIDEPDRGDEYNFDPPAPVRSVSAPISSPSISVESGPAVARLCLRMTYRIPRRLDADRETPSTEIAEVPIRSTVSLYAGVKRIDFVTEVDNGAADHRLRVHFETPLQAPAVRVEQAFCTVERPLELEAGGEIEQPIGTTPQKTFCAIGDGRLGVALFNRGIPEIEARRSNGGTELAMTLVRAVGWLSRGDLRLRKGHAGPAMETPEAQSPGPHRFEYALTTFAGDFEAANIVAEAHRFAYPPQAVAAERHEGHLPADAALMRCDNPAVVISALEPGRSPERYRVRVYNSSAASQSVCLGFPGARRVRSVNLAGQPAASGLRCGGDTARGSLRPFQIATLEITRA